MRIRHLKGVEEAVAACPYVVKDPAANRGAWKKSVFGNDNTLALEVGMGMGTFIRTLAGLNPDINYIGFELNTTVLYKSVKRYLNGIGEEMPPLGVTGEDALSWSEKDIPAGRNLRFIREDARFLADYFGEQEVDRIYLNFSDPWPKDKNANKRLTAPGFLKLYSRILKDDGCIEFKTDNRGLFDYSVETIPQNGWRIAEITYDLHNDESMNAGNICTEYEAKFSAKGNPIFKLIAVKSN